MIHRRLVVPVLAGIIILAAVLVPLSKVLASVSLLGFDAIPQTDRIVLRWETASEVETLGFNLWRGTECNATAATKLNQALIPAEGQGALGAEYEFEDLDVEGGVLYDYRLEDVENSGQTNCHQEYPEQAQLVEDNPLVTVTPVTNPGGGATSTTAPTSTPAPTETPAPTNTPRPPSPTVTENPSTDPTATVTTQGQPLASPTAFINPPATQSPEEPEEDETQAGETLQDDEGNRQEAPEVDEPEVLDSAGDPDVQATADALATAQAAGEEEAAAVAEAADATQPQTVGATQDSALLADQDTLASDSADDDDSSASTVSIVLVLVGGLFFTVGGIAAVWFFFINRRA